MAKVCLNAYTLRDVEALSWPVRRYSVTRRDGFALEHSERGSLKDAAYALRRQYQSRCRGWGFILDIDARTVVLPGAWQLPSRAETEELLFELAGEFTAHTHTPEHDAIVSGILREALKKHTKDTPFTALGPLWQDFGRFCQAPQFGTAERYAFCRSFFTNIRRMADGHWAVLVGLGTAVIDGYSVADYFTRGEALELADVLSWRRSSYRRRDGSPADVRAYVRDETRGRIVALQDAQALEKHCADSPRECMERLACSEFKQPPERLSPMALHLLVDPQQTEELHAETIIDPPERAQLAGTIAQYFQGAEVFGATLKLDNQPWDATSRTRLIRPPAVRVRAARGTSVIRCKEPLTPHSLHERARKRREHITRYGFLATRPMKPLIGVHESLGSPRARRLHRDATEILRHHGVGNVSFDYALYRDVPALSRQVRDGDYDALIAVLPGQAEVAAETHERIKQSIEVPSQCMQARNVVPTRWAERPPEEFFRNDAKFARRLQNRLEAVVLNLLVKHNWVPFVPAEPFHYNVQVGLDVGGLHDTHAMACLGYGFSDPAADLLFRLGEIPIRGQKKEPIPPTDLLKGLLELFEQVASVLTDAGVQPDFTRVLFYRDGPLLGHGDAWNEREALEQLYGKMTQQGWVRGEPLWTALEVLKDAEGLRVFELDPEICNPTVGRCTFPFADPRSALVNSTGRPYLSQGTAAPMKVRMIDVAGTASFADALQDFVWQCDLGFTKPDMGFSLPWVLHVADTGALQVSRSYRVTGIPA
jgi:hypothetical protein